MEGEGKELVLWRYNVNGSDGFAEDGRQFHLVDRQLTILQRPQAYRAPNSTLGTVAWDAGYVLSAYLDKSLGSHYLVNKRVLELGAGTGLVGIVAALLGAHVVLTDLQDLVELMEANVIANIPEDMRSRVQSTVLRWGEGLSEFKRRCEPEGGFDVILCSDVVYEAYAFEPLLSTLRALATDRTEIIMSYKKRYDIERKFWINLRKDFAIDVASKDLYPCGFQSTDVDIYHIRRKAVTDLNSHSTDTSATVTRE